MQSGEFWRSLPFWGSCFTSMDVTNRTEEKRQTLWCPTTMKTCLTLCHELAWNNGSCMLNFRSETFPPASPCSFSPVIRRSGYWHDWSYKYKWMKLASFEGWPRSEKKEDSRVGSGIRWRWLLSASGGLSTHLEGQAGEDPVPIGENTSHVVWGKPQDPPGETGKCCWVKDLDYHRNLLPPHPNQVRGG